MTDSNKNVLFAIRTARVAYEHLYRVNPFAALEYSASLLLGVRRCVEACPAIEVSPDWPLSERLAEFKSYPRFSRRGIEAVRNVWALERTLPA